MNVFLHFSPFRLGLIPIVPVPATNILNHQDTKLRSSEAQYDTSVISLVSLVKLFPAAIFDCHSLTLVSWSLGGPKFFEAIGAPETKG